MTTTRFGTETEFTDRKEIYTLNDQQSLYLAVRIDDGKVVLNNSVGGRLFELEDELSKQPTGVQK